MKMKKYGIIAAVSAVIIMGVMAALSFPSVVNQAEYRVRQLAGQVRELLSPDAANVYFIRQIVSGDMATTRTLMWETADARPDSFVDISVDDADESTRIHDVVHTELTEDGRTRYLHTVYIEDLLPDTAYRFRIGYGNRTEADSHTFRTGPVGGRETVFSVLVFPDSQSADYAGWGLLARTAYERHPDAAFAIAMGDLVDNGESAYQWDRWFAETEAIGHAVPWAPILGNHETYTLDWNIRQPIAYTTLFALPNPYADRSGAKRATGGRGLSTPFGRTGTVQVSSAHREKAERYANRFYSFDYGDVHFVALDTQFKEAEGFEPNLADDEIEWLRSDLAANTSKWTVVMMHKDTFRYANHRRPDIVPGFNEIGERFMPIFDEYGVDVVLSAHYHTYRNRGHVKYFERNADGPLYVLTGVAGDVRFTGLWIDHPLDEVVAPQPETSNYLTLSRTVEGLVIESYLPDGTRIDRIEVRK